MKNCAFLVEGLGAERVIDKLAGAGIAVLGAEKLQKNAVIVKVDGKDAKKVFAILQTSCYNIKKTSYHGGLRLVHLCKTFAGLLSGVVLFCATVLFFQSRVLRIEVTGSGAYLETSVKGILRENGVTVFSHAPRDTKNITASVLALPCVTFCTISHTGGVLTARVEVSDENATLKAEPLLSPASGTLLSLVVVRGTPLCAVGDGVVEGQELVGAYALTESGQRPVAVIAEAVVAYPVSVSYETDEQTALHKAYIEYGEIYNTTIKTTETGTLIEGTARKGVSLNLA